jgi:hypothetical protein
MQYTSVKKNRPVVMLPFGIFVGSRKISIYASYGYHYDL